LEARQRFIDGQNFLGSLFGEKHALLNWHLLPYAALAA
jgi:hypothetical protein